MRRKSFTIAVFLIVSFIIAGLSVNMAKEFVVNPYRFDPYKNFKFLVRWDGQNIPEIIKVSGLDRNTEIVESREGSDPSTTRIMPGKTTFEPIVLERGRTHDPAFEQWANKVWNYGSGLGSEVSLKDFRKDIIIQLLNEAGQVVMAFKIYRCWPSHYSALGPLDANSSDIATEKLVLQCEGWERDYSVTEPTEPSFTEP